QLTPILCLISSLLICTAVYEPSRGASDHSNYLEATTWIEDMKYLFTHKSFLLVSLGFTAVAFVTGSLALWAPQYVYYSILVQPNQADDSRFVSMIFGVITVVSGILGVTLGSGAAGLLRRKTSLADPYVCAFGMISSAPFLFLALYLSRYNTVLCIFLGETLLFLNWALVSDMLLYLVVPTRRSTAASLQILMSHALGDAGSPTLVGLVSDSIKRSFNSTTHDIMMNYQSLQFALYMDCFICVVGGGFFLAASLFINRDRRETQRIMKGWSINVLTD
ncbi:hypothetical protein HELRODRAFT_78664, partial [Helobdella robusta]|uniref:Major facilitator superfamily (MFS) profile domain-containing protein n=1 Tax=Helobdella robusta TaxID=6412 RepID=T1G3E3_HELRO